jgi:hypothetical protein
MDRKDFVKAQKHLQYNFIRFPYRLHVKQTENPDHVRVYNLAWITKSKYITYAAGDKFGHLFLPENLT